jgi:alpha-galactosidase
MRAATALAVVAALAFASPAAAAPTNGFIEPGEQFTATVSLADDGVTPVQDAALELDVPDGWTAEPQGPTTFDAVPGGRTVSATFAVVSPAGAAKGRFDLDARARYRPVRGEGERELRGYGTVTIATPPSGEPWLSDLDPLTVAVGYGKMGIDKTVDGRPLNIAGVPYAKGIAPHAASEVTYYLGGTCSRFTSDVGVDDETRGRGSVTFEVLGDDRKPLASTGVITGGQAAQQLDVDVSGVTVLTLVTGIGPDNNNSDHSEWAAARLSCAEGAAVALSSLGGFPPPLAPAEPASRATAPRGRSAAAARCRRRRPRPARGTRCSPRAVRRSRSRSPRPPPAATTSRHGRMRPAARPTAR